MRDKPFETIQEIEAYLDNPEIQCLECGKKFKALGTHLSRAHHMTHDDYREKWEIPKRFALAGTATREILSEQMRDYIDSGRLTYDHLDEAVEASRKSEQPRKKTGADYHAHREIVATVRPGDHSRLPPGAKRANGKDADREREYQRAYRAQKNGDPEPMMQYKIKYGAE